MLRLPVLLALSTTLASADLSYSITPDSAPREEHLTLTAALTDLAARRAKGQTETAEFLLHGGAYILETIIDGTLAGDGLTFRSANPESEFPVITGGSFLAQKWTVKDGLWTATLDHEPAAFYVNNNPATLAREPDNDFWRIEKSGPDRRTSFTWQENTIPEVKDLAHLSLVFLHDWSTTHVPIQSLDPKTRTLTTTLPIGPKADHYRIDHFEPQPRFFLQGSRDFLDTPGEWHYDRDTKTISYLPRPGEAPDKTEAVATHQLQLLTLRGTPENPVKNVHFEAITFSHAQWLPAGRRFAGGQASFHEDGESFTRTPVPCSVEADYCENLIFTSCRFRESSGGGLWIREQCTNVRIGECSFNNLGANGLMIGVTGDPKIPTSHVTVEKSVITNCGQRYYGSVGLWIGIAAHCTIRNNEIHDLPYTGLSLGWRWSPVASPSKNHLIENNHIHHVLQTLSDGGGIYTLGLQPDSIIRGNHIHDVRVNAGRAESNGIFMDQGSTGFLVENNHIHHIARSPIRFHQAGKNSLRHNKLEPSAGIPPLKFNNTPEENITVK